MQINSNVEPVFSEQTRVELDAVYAGEKPYIYANVNGQKLLFLLDTGARFLILMDTLRFKAWTYLAALTSHSAVGVKKVTAKPTKLKFSVST